MKLSPPRRPEGTAVFLRVGTWRRGRRVSRALLAQRSRHRLAQLIRKTLDRRES
jgi:hypothetical protein